MRRCDVETLSFSDDAIRHIWSANAFKGDLPAAAFTCRICSGQSRIAHGVRRDREPGMKIMWRALTFVFLWMGAWTCVQGGDISTQPQPDVPPPAHPAAMAPHALADMPLWAYGITTLPRPGDTAEPQGWVSMTNFFDGNTSGL